MIELKTIKGKNKKFWIEVLFNDTKEDFEIIKRIKEKILFRKEWNAFINGGTYFTANYCFEVNGRILIPYGFKDLLLKQLNDILEYDLHFDDSEFKKNSDISIDFVYTDILANDEKLPDNIKLDDNYNYQRESVYECIKNKIGCIEVGTSGGKTFITFLYCRWIFNKLYNKSNDNERILIVVPSIILVDQLLKDFNDFQKNFKIKMGIEGIYSGIGQILSLDKFIVVGTYQSISKKEQDWFEKFNVFICDELHTAKAWSINNDIYGKLRNCEYFFGMTGTFPEFNKTDYLHIVNMFGTQRILKSASELIKDGNATPIQICCIKLDYSDSEYDDFSENLKNNGIIGAEKYQMEKVFFQTLEQRTKIISDILNLKIGASVILVNTVDYAFVLKEYLTKNNPEHIIHVITGSIKERDYIIEEAKNSLNKKFIIIATTKILATGVSIPALQYLYIVDGGKSQILQRQSIGRLMRLFNGKEKGYVFDFYDNLKKSSFKYQAMERLKTYKNNGFPVQIYNKKIKSDE